MDRSTPLWRALRALPGSQIVAALSAVRARTGSAGKGQLSGDEAVDEIVAWAAPSLGTAPAVLAALGIQATGTETAAIRAVAERADAAVTALALKTDMNRTAIDALSDALRGFHAEVTDRRTADAAASEAHRAAAATETARIAASLDKLASDTATRLDRADRASTLTVDQGMVDSAVAAAVASAFGPFADTVTASAAPAVAALASTLSSVVHKTVEEVFGVAVYTRNGKHLTVPVLVPADPTAPAVDPLHQWTPKILRALARAANGDGTWLSNVWLAGEKAAGKTSSAVQFAARCGRPVTRLNFHRFSMIEEFVGAIGLDGGSTGFIPGPFLSAFTRPYSVIVLDEPSLPDPGVMAVLNGYLEIGSRVSYGGSTWVRGVGVMGVACDNTAGNGDVTGRYHGTQAQNAALVDRYGMVIQMSALPIETEIAAVVAHTGCAEALARHVLEAVHLCRQKVTDGDMIDAPSLRNVVSFILALDTLPVDEAWQSTIAARQPVDGMLGLIAVYETAINSDLINSLL